MKDEEETDTGAVVVVSSASELTEFIKGFIWADMGRELDVWLEGVRSINEDPGTPDRERLIALGRIDAIKHFLLLPEVVRDSLIADQTSQQDDKEAEKPLDNDEEREDLFNV